MTCTLADVALSGGWTPTNVLIVIVAVGYVAVAIINALKGNPQQQSILQQIQGLQGQLSQHTTTLQTQIQQQQAVPQLLNLVASNPQLLQALLLQHRQQQQQPSSRPVVASPPQQPQPRGMGVDPLS